MHRISINSIAQFDEILTCNKWSSEKLNCMVSAIATFSSEH